jgi:predicted AAA+ superfamily ATPase
LSDIFRRSLNGLRLDELFHPIRLVLVLFVVVLRLNMFEGLPGVSMIIIILKQVVVGVIILVSLYINWVSYIVNQAINNLVKSFKFFLRRGTTCQFIHWRWIIIKDFLIEMNWQFKIRVFESWLFRRLCFVRRLLRLN